MTTALANAIAMRLANATRNSAPYERTDGLTEKGLTLRGNLSGRNAHATQTLFGIPIVESPLLRANQALLVRGQLLAGDPGHFVHRLHMSAIKALMRADLEKALDDFAARWGITR